MISKSNILLIITAILLTTLEPQAQVTNFDKQNNDTSYNARSRIIEVPEGKGKQVVTDGMFSIGEWDDALNYSVADNYDIYLKADSEILYVGLKSAEPIGECICEIRVTSNEKEVFLLHVSGCLGEGISGFPATTKFDLNNNRYWEANFLSADSLKRAAWFAAGHPVDKYGDMYEKRDGIEFKIYRKKFTGNSLKFTIGWITIDVKGNEYHKNLYNYPENASLSNADNWAEFILPATKSPYLGQNPPGLTPKIFAPEIVSTEHGVYANVTFNPELTEVCWTPNSADTTFWHGGILFSKKNNGVWSEPKEIRFLGEGYNHRSPYYGLIGKRLYFQGHQAIHQGWDQKEKFYFVEKTPQGWSEPTLLDSIFNKYAVHWTFSLDSDNNLYFGGDLRGVENTGGIYCSKFVNGKYQEPKLIFSNQQYGEAVFGPAISPDGSYILFARIHPRGSTNPRIFSIYISFRKGEDGWTKPLELGEKLDMDGNQPRISPDGEYIFFIGNDSQAYWVDGKIIETLKPEGLKLRRIRCKN